MQIVLGASPPSSNQTIGGGNASRASSYKHSKGEGMPSIASSFIHSEALAYHHAIILTKSSNIQGNAAVAYTDSTLLIQSPSVPTMQ